MGIMEISGTDGLCPYRTNVFVAMNTMGGEYMFDTRCYNCCDMGTKVVNLPIMNYVGKGLFCCPVCNKITDFSDIILLLTIKVKKEQGDESTYNDIDILGGYDKLDELFGNVAVPTMINKDQILDDIYSSGLDEWIDNHNEGTFEIDLLWNWYKCGGEGDEWDLDIDILYEKVI